MALVKIRKELSSEWTNTSVFQHVIPIGNKTKKYWLAWIFNPLVLLKSVIRDAI